MKTNNNRNVSKVKQPELRNKFLSSVDLDDVGDFNSSFEDSFIGGRNIDDSPSPTDQSASLQNFIYSGLIGGENGETYEVVEVIQVETNSCKVIVNSDPVF